MFLITERKRRFHCRRLTEVVVVEGRKKGVVTVEEGGGDEHSRRGMEEIMAIER